MSLVTVDAVNAFIESDFPGVGNRCEEVGDGWAIAHCGTSSLGMRPGGIISGPTVFALCDAAFYYACFTAIGLEPMVLTSELSIRFLRPGRGQQLRARADLHHVGRRSVIATVVAWTDDPAKPVAVAQGTYVRPTASSTAR